MNIFISYAGKDYSNIKPIIDSLKNAGYPIWVDREQIQVGESILHSLQSAMNQADIIVAFITDNYNISPNTSAELGAALIGKSAAKLIAIVVGDTNIPFYLSGHTYRKYNEFSEKITGDIINDIKGIASEDSNLKQPSTKTYTLSEDKIKFENENTYINKLKKALDNNNLTIVCGAGVSVSAGIPTWNTLLLSMLNKCVNDEHKFEIEAAQQALPTSSIILGKYLKLLLGKDFETTIKLCLYEHLGESESYLGKKVYNETELIHSIIKLIRPKRNRGSVESVITFNFDSLIEDTLDKYGIENQAIYDEGTILDTTKIPIYHVHGYLPKNKDIKTSNIVFSEDAYHTQFIDPYSWSNLTQLYKYMNNTCLLIGLSITDPNLRRLLDISGRKNNTNKPRHYIIKKNQILQTVSVKLRCY